MLIQCTRRIRIHTDTMATVIRITTTPMRIRITGWAGTTVVAIIAAGTEVDTGIAAEAVRWFVVAEVAPWPVVAAVVTAGKITTPAGIGPAAERPLPMPWRRVAANRDL